MKPLHSDKGLMPGPGGRQADIYTDLNGLQKIKQLNKDNGGNREQALAAIASQFESIFVSMMMKSMREANEAFKDETMNNSSEMQFYEQMFDQQLALSLANGGGIGLSEALVRQLKNSLPGADATQKPAPADPFADYRVPLQSRTRPQTSNAPARADNSAVTGAQPDATAGNDFVDQQDFIEKMLPLAEKAARSIGVDARFLLSQAALETGWGKHLISDSSGRNSHNLFGIKAGEHWRGEVAVVDSLEYRDGLPAMERASFRAYASYADSFEDYVQFLSQQPRYAQALQAAAEGPRFVQELQRAGYATDPDYAAKITNIVSRNLPTAAEADRG